MLDGSEVFKFSKVKIVVLSFVKESSIPSYVHMDSWVVGTWNKLFFDQETNLLLVDLRVLIPR